MPFSLTMNGAVLELVLRGTVTADDLRLLADEVAALERTLMSFPNRLGDLTGVEEWAATLPAMSAVADRRRREPPGSPIRTALLVATPVQYGYGRMFATLNDHPMVTVMLFHDRPQAMAWLTEETG